MLNQYELRQLSYRSFWLDSNGDQGRSCPGRMSETSRRIETYIQEKKRVTAPQAAFDLQTKIDKVYNMINRMWGRGQIRHAGWRGNGKSAAKVWEVI